MKYVLFVLLFGLVACQEAGSLSYEEVNLHYIRDGDLCFAYVDSVTYYGYTVRSITNVDCAAMYSRGS